jgi:hypothetical protein
LIPVLSVPFGEVGKGPDAVNAGIGPKIDEDHSALELV